MKYTFEELFLKFKEKNKLSNTGINFFFQENFFIITFFFA